MDLKVIKKLIEYLKQNDLTEINYRSGKDEITLKQTLNAVANPTAVSEVNHDDADSTNESSDELNTLKSPLVGLFYVAKSPKDAPFVKVGDQIQSGDTIGIIEAMKVMTPIRADRSGVVAKILVNDGEEVEYDEPLIQIKATN